MRNMGGCTNRGVGVAVDSKMWKEMQTDSLRCIFPYTTSSSDRRLEAPNRPWGPNMRM